MQRFGIVWALVLALLTSAYAGKTTGQDPMPLRQLDMQIESEQREQEEMAELERQAHEQAFFEVLNNANAELHVTSATTEKEVDAALREMERRLKKERKAAIDTKNQAERFHAESALESFKKIANFFGHKTLRERFLEQVEKAKIGSGYRSNSHAAQKFGFDLEPGLLEKAKSYGARKARACAKALGGVALLTMTGLWVGPEAYEKLEDWRYPATITLEVHQPGSKALIDPKLLHSRPPTAMNSQPLVQQDQNSSVRIEHGLGELILPGTSAVFTLSNGTKVEIARDTAGTTYLARPDGRGPDYAPLFNHAYGVTAVSGGVVYLSPGAANWEYSPGNDPKFVERHDPPTAPETPRGTTGASGPVGDWWPRGPRGL